MKTALFDTWTKKYDSWFETPSGRFVRNYESALLLELLAPLPGERILDVGCGTGIFTMDILDRGALVTGVDLSLPMLKRALSRTAGTGFTGLCADMYSLPFPDNSFDKVFSMTAIEFVADARAAIVELERVTKRGGSVVVTTLNSLSPWAEQRRCKAQEGHALFENIHFRSPEDMRRIVPGKAEVRTAIHFQKHDPVEDIPEIERTAGEQHPEKGAFLAVRWKKEQEGI